MLVIRTTKLLSYTRYHGTLDFSLFLPQFCRSLITASTSNLTSSSSQVSCPLRTRLTTSHSSKKSSGVTYSPLWSVTFVLYVYEFPDSCTKRHTFNVYITLPRLVGRMSHTSPTSGLFGFPPTDCGRRNPKIL